MVDGQPVTTWEIPWWVSGCLCSDGRWGRSREEVVGLRQLIGDRFEIADPKRDLLGRGGMGDVYRGRDLQTGESVAMKALRPEVVTGDPNALARFLREGEALRQLDHPNIVQMVDGVEADGRHYLVMEYVSGGSLRDLLDERQSALRLSWPSSS